MYELVQLLLPGRILPSPRNSVTENKRFTSWGEQLIENQLLGHLVYRPISITLCTAESYSLVLENDSSDVVWNVAEWRYRTSP